MNNPDEYYSEFGYYVHEIVDQIDKRGNQMFQDNLGISLMQFSLLILFDSNEATVYSQKYLSERLGIAKSAVSRHISIARRKGWLTVRPSEESRRQNTLTLTADGKSLLKQAKRLIRKSEKQGFGDMDPRDVEATLRVLKALNNKMTE